MTATLVASPTTPAPSAFVTASAAGLADLRTRYLLDGVVVPPTVCSPTGGAASAPIQVASVVGAQTISVEQNVAGTWTSAATAAITVTAPPSGTGLYPDDRAFGFLATTEPTVPTRPSYLGTYIEPTYSNEYMRLTNANQDGHAYSRCGPGGWSKSGDKILCNFGTVANHIIDAATGTNLVTFSAGELVGMACWMPADNNKLIGISPSVANRLVYQNATTKALTTIAAFNGSGGWPSVTTLSLGEYEGGISDDGRYVALIGDISGSARLMTVDLSGPTLIANIAAPAGISDCQISPSGAYVTVGCTAGKRRYPISLASSIVLTANNNHADSGVDASGNDVLVCNNPVTGKVTSYRLSDGLATLLFGSTSTAYEYGHVGRARLRPGWIYLSVYDTTTTAGRRGDDLIIAVKLDGSMVVEVFGPAFNRTTGSVYAAQPHACPSPDGSVVMFRSPWGSVTTSIYLFTVWRP